MNIYAIHSGGEEASLPRGILHGRLSYIARGNALRAEKLASGTSGDIMVLNAEEAGEHVTAAIFDECRRREYTGVFLDATKACKNATALGEISASLSRRGLRTFCPLEICDLCPAAIPVAEGCVSGGSISEYFSHLAHGRGALAFSIPRLCTRFLMPAYKADGEEIPLRKARQLMNMFDATPHYSPQMMTNYFIYSTSREGASYVLFDDARSISERIKLAKQLGATDVFLSYPEVSDIIDDLML